MRLTHIAVAAVVGMITVTARSQTFPPANGPTARVSMAQLAQPPQPGPPNDSELLPAPEPGARQGLGLTLADLEQMAVQNNPTLSQARAAVQAARGVWQQVGLHPNPVAGYAAEEMGDEGTAGKQGGFIGQEFVTAGKLRLNRQVACQEVIRLEQELAAQQFRVLTDVRTAFYDVLVAQRTLELADRLVKIAEEGVQAAEALLKAGWTSCKLGWRQTPRGSCSKTPKTAISEHGGDWPRW
jgi:outer membrane protein TolC